MRLFLLLSALLTAFAGSGVPAQAAGYSPRQVSALVASAAKQVAVAKAARRPVLALPAVHDVRVEPFIAASPVTIVPLYAGRLRT